MKAGLVQATKVVAQGSVDGMLLSVMLSLFLFAACSQATVDSPSISENDYEGIIRVACVGDSLTFGANLNQRDRDAYSVQLGRMLGAKWKTRNFGCPGTTVLKASKETTKYLTNRKWFSQF